MVKVVALIFNVHFILFFCYTLKLYWNIQVVICFDNYRCVMLVLATANYFGERGLKIQDWTAVIFKRDRVNSIHALFNGMLIKEDRIGDNDHYMNDYVVESFAISLRISRNGKTIVLGFGDRSAALNHSANAGHKSETRRVFWMTMPSRTFLSK